MSPRRQPEKRVQQAVKRTLKTLGFHVSDLSQPRASMQTPGLPDLFVMHNRYGWLWIEVKAPGGRLSPAQRAWHEEADAAGVRVATVWSVDDLVRELQRLGVPINQT